MWGTKRPATDDDMSRSVRLLLRGLGEGWRHRCEYSSKLTAARRKVDGAFEVVEFTAHYVVVHMRHPSGVGAFAIFVDGSYDFGAVWNICSDPDCTIYPDGREHPGITPRFGVPYREMCVITSDVPVLEFTE